MGRRAITQEVYENIVRAFHEVDKHGTAAVPEYTHAARLAGVDRKTAERAWSVGWPKKGMPSVQSVMVEEQLAARARLQAEHATKIAQQQREREEARKQAVEARAQEGQVVQLARTSSLQALAISNQLLGGARKLAGIVRTTLEAEATKPPTEQMSARALLDLMGRVTSMSESINRAAHAAMTMERLHLGQPTQIIEHVDDRDDLTMEEAMLRVQAAQQAIDTAQRSAKLTVIQGGVGEDLADTA